MHGKPSAFPLLSNVFATRQRCALSLGMKPNDGELPLSLEYARREDMMLAPVTISAPEAPVKEVVTRGDECDLRNFPIVRHHDMDPAPYIDMTPVMRHPEDGFYNVAFLRTMYKGPTEAGHPHVAAAQLADFSPTKRAAFPLRSSLSSAITPRSISAR